MSKTIDDALGLVPMPYIEHELEPLPTVISGDQVEVGEEISQARSNLHDAVSVAQQAVQDMLAIAQQSQHPKAYEALNSLIKTYADISMGLADLQVKKQRLTGKPTNEDAKTINNNLFVGSTSELLKMLESHSRDE